jgi:hypothetical protein
VYSAVTGHTHSITGIRWRWPRHRMSATIIAAAATADASEIPATTVNQIGAVADAIQVALPVTAAATQGGRPPDGAQLRRVR